MNGQQSEHADDGPSNVTSYSTKKKLIVLFLWICIWPVSITIIAVGVLILEALVLGSWMTANSSGAEGYKIRTYIAVFTATLVVISYLFIWFFGRSKSHFLRLSRGVLRSYMWAGIILGTLIIIVIPDPQATTTDAGININQTNGVIVPNLASDPSIVRSLQIVGATDISNIETKWVNGYDNTVVTDQMGEYQAFVNPTTGKWVYGVLTMKQGTSANELNVAVAHEYLHHVWFKTLDENTKVRLTSDLIAMYGNDASMQRRVESYADHQTLQSTELFSYYCTESSDGYLTNYVLSECNKYINRGALQLAR